LVLTVDDVHAYVGEVLSAYVTAGDAHSRFAARHRIEESEDGGPDGEDADDVAASAQFLVESLLRLFDPTRRPRATIRQS
jgi:hypothetical protein